MTKKTILNDVMDILQDRNKTHGDFMRVMVKASKMWSAYLGVKISTTDALECMSLLKKAREKVSPSKEHRVDDIGYSVLRHIAISGDCNI